MRRITGVLARWAIFKHIYLVALAHPGDPLVSEIDGNRTICRLPTSFKDSRNLLRRIARFLAWYVAVIRKFRRQELTCINAHSLSTLPLGVILKAVTGAKLIYDTHELETETLNMVGLARFFGKATEAVFVRFADKVVVVGFMIADWYRQRYPPLDPVVVRNLPEDSPNFERHDVFRERCNIPASATIFFYQGVLAEARGVDITLEAFSNAPPTHHVVFLGYGPLSSMIEEYAKLHSNIHYLPAVPPQDVRRYTQSGDVGMCVAEPECLSYKYGMPNKVFEYLGAGVPAIVSNLPELSCVIGLSGSGWVISPNPQELLKLILSIQRPDILERGKKALQWTKNNSWAAETVTLHQMYSQLGFLPPPLS